MKGPGSLRARILGRLHNPLEGHHHALSQPRHKSLAYQGQPYQGSKGETQATCRL